MMVQHSWRIRPQTVKPHETLAQNSHITTWVTCCCSNQVTVQFSRSVVSDSLRPHESQLCHQIKWQRHYVQISQLEHRTLMGKEIRNSLSWCLYQKTNLKNIRGQEKWHWAGEVGVEGWAVLEVKCSFNS